ncbi:MAG: T9SS type A sorting domain-containing protein [Alteromonas sp.]|nr:T9SS type A sorting domain-containing protein [Alteromonas sp.]
MAQRAHVPTSLRRYGMLCLMILLCSSLGFSQNRMTQWVNEAKVEGISFQKVQVWTPTTEKYSGSNDFLRPTEVQYLNYQPNFGALSAQAIAMELPLGTQTVTLEVREVPDTFDNYLLVTDQGPYTGLDRSQARHFRGVIKGDDQSLVALSFFDDHMVGLISNAEGNFNIVKLQDSNKHIVYNDTNLRAANPFECQMEDTAFEGYDRGVLMRPLEQGGATRAFETNCVSLYFETEFDVYQFYGNSVPNVENYVTALYNQVAIIYQNEGIDTSISMINVWTTTDPYTATSTGALLSQFQANTGAFTGDLGQLLTRRNIGGGQAAGFAGICNANSDLSLAVAGNLDSSTTPFPTYSWNVMVITHEFGHLFGSRHTHACVWNGNNTAIDGCAGFTEGGCTLPGIPPTGGTIMSYCHIQTVGINFSNGFGLQPGNVIRDRVANGACLGTCSPCPIVGGTFDLYSKDRPFDTGVEPNPDTGPMWISEDIWVRQNMDGGTTPENPEYKLYSPNGVYVKVRNRGGNTSTCAVLKVYFSKASTGLQWPTHFNNYYQNVGVNSVLHGDIIGTATLPPIPAGGSITVEIPWYPPNPADYTNDVHHFCLVSRILSPNDPMFNEVAGSVSPNVRNNNNIAWKNVSVYDTNPNNLPPPTSVFIRGINPNGKYINLRFFDRGFGEQVDRKFFDGGKALIKMEPALFELMHQAGSLEGPGIEVVDENLVVVYSDEAVFRKVPLEYGKTYSMTLSFEVGEPLRPDETMLFDIVQEDAKKGTFEGGERFLLVFNEEGQGEARPENTGYGFQMVPNPSEGQFDMVLDVAGNGQYQILDIYGNTVAEGSFTDRNSLSVDFSGQRAGIYFVKVVTDRIHATKILVKK